MMRRKSPNPPGLPSRGQPNPSAADQQSPNSTALPKYVVIATVLSCVLIIVVATSGSSGDAENQANSARNTKSGRAAAAADYPHWTDKHRSLTRKHLTHAIYDQLYDRETSFGFTIDNVIQPAIDLPMAEGVAIGCVAGDAESYTVFAPFFNAVIQEYHGHKSTSVHTSDLDYKKLRIPALDAKYVLSTRIRAARSVKGFQLPPAASRGSRRAVESLLSSAFSTLEGDLVGTYISLNDMTAEEHQRLIDQHILFEDPDMWTISAGFGRDWPDGRGVFISADKSFTAWVNEEDHLRIIALKQGAGVADVFRLFADASTSIEAALSRVSGGVAGFATSPHLGFITTCPTNLGTGLRASVHAKFPLLEQHEGLKEFAKSLGLQIRGKGGEKDKARTGVVDVSNRHRLGYSEVELVQRLLDGLAKLIELEKKLEAGEPVSLAV